MGPLRGHLDRRQGYLPVLRGDPQGRHETAVFGTVMHVYNKVKQATKP